MKIELFKELFDKAVFPIFVTDEVGIVLYKNASSGKYLPMIRKSASVCRHLRDPKMSTDISEIIGGAAYRRAIVMRENDMRIFFCFSRLQYPDGEDIARAVIEQYGKTFVDFVAAVKNEEDRLSQTESFVVTGIQGRVYSDILALFEKKPTDLKTDIYNMVSFADIVFGKLSDAFSALGFRIQTSFLGDLKENCLAKFNPSDFLFLFHRLLYLQMKVSANGVIEITLSYDDQTDEHIFSFSTTTSLTQNHLIGKNVADFFCELVPECLTEFILFSKIDSFRKTVEASIDRAGILTIRHRIPHFAKIGTFTLRSIDLYDTSLKEETDRMILAIQSRFLQCT